jgi:trehalose 6-phosphate phosphatase
VGVDGIAYAGSHGAELLMPGEQHATILPAFAEHAGRVHRFVESRDDGMLRVEDKGPIVALHWRGLGDEAAAEARAQQIAREAEDGGLLTHWGRKVLEIRPPVEVHKGQAVEELVRRFDARAGLFAGDDVTDLDGFDALRGLELDAAVCVGVASDEGPPEIVERADLVVDGPEGFVAVLTALAG